jgi:hypothetical protein
LFPLLIDSFLRFVSGEFNWLITEFYVSFGLPSQGVFQPVVIITFGEIITSVSAATLFASYCGHGGDFCKVQ